MKKQTIKVSTVKEMLENGLTRTEIQEKFGLKDFELKRLFQHPKLKGLRTKVGVSFIIEDDTIENENVSEQTTKEWTKDVLFKNENEESSNSVGANWD